MNDGKERRRVEMERWVRGCPGGRVVVQTKGWTDGRELKA
jgi:hypothetical protein